MFSYRPLLRCLITAILIFPLALSGSDDRDQPVDIKADEVDMDLKSGVRLYRGNVSVTIGTYPQEGSIRIRADRIKMTFSNSDLKIELDQSRLRPIDADLQIPNTKKFQDHTGWKPEISYEKTMLDLLNYWRERIKSKSDFIIR